MRLTLSRLCAAALLVVLAGCSNGSEEAKPPSSPATADGPAPAGVLSPADLPFEPTTTEDVDEAGPLTDVADSCLGSEGQVLLDTDWTFQAREYADAKEWDLTSGVLTPPEGAPDAGIDLIRAASEECLGQQEDLAVTPLQLGGASYGFEEADADGKFASARAYVRLDGGALAQLTLEAMPSGQDATEVLKELVATLAQ